MSDILDDNGVNVDVKTYDTGKNHPAPLEGLFGATGCVLRELRSPEQRTATSYATDHEIAIMSIRRGDEALGGYAVLFATNHAVHERYFDKDNICVDKETNTERGYIVGREPTPAPRSGINTASSSRFARLDAASNASVASTRGSILAT